MVHKLHLYPVQKLGGGGFYRAGIGPALDRLDLFSHRGGRRYGARDFNVQILIIEWSVFIKGLIHATDIQIYTLTPPLYFSYPFILRTEGWHFHPLSLGVRCNLRFFDV